MGNYDCCQFGELSLRTFAGLRFVQSIQTILEPGKQIVWRDVVSLFMRRKYWNKTLLVETSGNEEILVAYIPLGDEAMSD